jgi:hypothetical protein
MGVVVPLLPALAVAVELVDVPNLRRSTSSPDIFLIITVDGIRLGINAGALGVSFPLPIGTVEGVVVAPPAMEASGGID